MKRRSFAIMGFVSSQIVGAADVIGGRLLRIQNYCA
jgi:hypothetical protein